MDKRDINVPIQLDDQQGAIRGTLSIPHGATDIQILVHGATYNRQFWDLPYQPDTYSYVHQANNYGFATLAIDRIGVGQSWRPSAHKVTLDTNIDAMQQVIQAVNSGTLGYTFRRVFVVGHSFGAIVANATIGRYGGVDGYVALGSANWMNAVNLVTRTFRYMPFPAVLDHHMRRYGAKLGDVTSRSDARPHMFYNTAHTDEQVINTDEQYLRDVDSIGTFLSLFIPPYFLRRDMRQVSVPVLAINGSEDLVFSGGRITDRTTETGFNKSMHKQYPQSPHLETILATSSGHNVTLERDASTLITYIHDFLNRIGTHPRQWKVLPR